MVDTLVTPAGPSSPPQAPGAASPTPRGSVRSDVRLLVPALAAWAVVAVALSWPAVSVWVASVAALGAGCLALTRRGVTTPATEVAVLSLLLTGLSLVAVAAHSTARTTGLVPGLAAQRAVAVVDAVVSADPVVRPSTDGSRPPTVLLRLRVERVLGRGMQSGATTPVLAFAHAGTPAWAALRWQERVRLVGRLAPAEPGADVAARLTPIGLPVRLEPPGLVARTAEGLREGLRQASSGLPDDARGLLPGLVIGDRSRTPPDLTEAMQSSGLSHLDAVSGTNVSMVLAAGLGLCRVVGLRRTWRPLVCVAVLAGFVVIARPEPSVLRAAVMGVVGLVGLLASRRSAGLPALAAAVLALLWVDPWLARSYGFALSTLATLGLLLFARPWGRWLAGRLPRRCGFLGHAVAIPLAAQAVCGPVVVLLQGSVSLVSLPANLLAAPLVAPATVLGVTAALLAVAHDPLAAAVAWPAGMAAQGIALIARGAAGVPMGQLPWPDGAPGAVLLALSTATVLLLGPWLVRTARQRWVATGSVLVLLGAALWPTGSTGWPPAGWQFVACDVGQGDGLVLSSGPGRAVVVDAGPDPALIDGCLARLGVAVVDALVLTHFHADHVDGLPGVLRGRRVHQVLTGPVSDPAYQAREVRERARAAGVPVRTVFAGDHLSWGQVSALLLWPSRVIHDGSLANNASLVMLVRVGALRLLLLGDVEEAAAEQVRRALRAHPERVLDPRLDVVKVAHHGSRLQDAALMELARAPVAVISVGADNGYGHPSAATLRLLLRTGHRVFRTDRSGDLAVLRAGSGPVRVATSRGAG